MKTDRRSFIKKSTVGGVGLFTFPEIISSAVIKKTSPSNRVNVAVIGCGRQTVTPNIPQLLESEHAKIVGVCDVDSWRLENARNQVNQFYSKQTGKAYTGCKVWPDFRDVLHHKDVDAVLIATPDHWHIPMAIEAARAGKHISLEKPISTCIEHGKQLMKTLKKYNVITRNDSEFRTLPAFYRAIELVRNGRIGTVKTIFVSVPSETKNSSIPPQPTMPVPEELNYDMWLGPAWEAPYTEKRVHAIKAYGRPNWMRIDAYCNGMISNWGAHLMGIAQWGNNTEYTGPLSVEGTGDFDKGLWNSMNRFDLKYVYENGVELFFNIERPYVKFEGTDGWIEVEYPDKLTASSKAILDSEIGLNELHIKIVHNDKDDFLLAVKNGKPSLEPLETAHRTISMCQLGLIAIKAGAKIKWDPVKEEVLEDNAASALMNIPIREKYFKF